MKETFERVEKKYVLSYGKYEALVKKLDVHIERDKYFNSSIRSIYYDIDAYQMISRSMESLDYKEKINAAGGSDGDNAWDFGKGGTRPDKGNIAADEGTLPGRDMMPDLQKNEASAEDASYVTGAVNMMDMTSAKYGVVINGGSITVDASGDGIDSNGSIIINGGNTVVYGPSNSGMRLLTMEQNY